MDKVEITLHYKKQILCNRFKRVEANFFICDMNCVGNMNALKSWVKSHNFGPR